MLKGCIGLASLFMLMCHVCTGQQPVVFEGQPDLKQPVNIEAQTYFFDDHSGDTLSFADIKKQHFIAFTTGLKQTNAANRPMIVNWLQFSVQNASNKDTLKLVFLCNTQIFIQLYSDDQPNSRPFSFEQIRMDPTGMLLVIPPNKTNAYYVRVVNFVRKLQPLNAELHTPVTYLQLQRRNSANEAGLFMVMCAALGCLFFIGVCACYSLLQIRDRALACYTAYVFIAFYVWLATIDTRFNLGVFGAPAWGPDLPYVSAAIFFYALFIVRILDIPTLSPKKWRVIKVLLALNLTAIVMECIEHLLGRFLFSSNIYYRYILNIPNAAINLYLIYFLIIHKGRMRKYLLAGLISLFFLVVVMNNVAYYISIRAHSPGVKIFTNFPPLWAMLGVVAETICFAFALIYRSKLLNEEKIQLQKKIVEAEMTALRAQMNPHFIFNCLNSIKLYTLENDSETASAYLTTFSRMVRLVLENSRAATVTLANELETLRLYIELEIMRFKHKVSYSIHVAGNVDADFIEVPPLLLQPFVENAIWHGLMHKDLGGTVTVDLTQPGEHLLVVEITDDGVGREMAAIYKSKSIVRHKSFGLKMTAERVQTEILVTDLWDDDGKARGTKVTIHVPI